MRRDEPTPAGRGRGSRAGLAGALLAGALLTGCSAAESAPVSHADEHSTVEHDGVDGVARIALSDRAVDRLDVRLVEAGTAADGRTVVPFAALLYRADGSTLVYVQDGPATYLSHPVTVAAIEGERVVLDEGPPPGTAVVTDGAAELLGAELGVGGH